jgi:hypothetical protein
MSRKISEPDEIVQNYDSVGSIKKRLGGCLEATKSVIFMVGVA